jgi:hypothetical protein
MTIAVDDVAHDPATPAALAQCATDQEELEKIRAMLNQKHGGLYWECDCLVEYTEGFDQPWIPQLMMDTLDKAKKERAFDRADAQHGRSDRLRFGDAILAKTHRICGIDSWCAAASQVDWFEAMKLFVESSAQHFKAKGNKVPFPDQKYLRI